jgi:hypothetical protein
VLATLILPISQRFRPVDSQGTRWIEQTNLRLVEDVNRDASRAHRGPPRTNGEKITDREYPYMDLGLQAGDNRAQVNESQLGGQTDGARGGFATCLSPSGPREKSNASNIYARNRQSRGTPAVLMFLLVCRRLFVCMLAFC